MTWAPLLPELRRATRGDITAGLTVSAYAVPQVMAYSALAGLPPQTGLWALAVVLVVYVFTGSSRYLSTGPESTTALLTATTLAPLAMSSSARYVALAAALAALLGLFALVAWLLRLGFMGDLLSKPVLVGYVAGLAVIMTVSQLTKVTGVPTSGDTIIGEVSAFITNASQVHWPTLAMSLTVVVALLALTPLLPRLPMPLIVVLVATGLTAWLGLDAYGIQTAGAVPSALPTLGIPDVTLEDLRTLAFPALGLLVVGYSENLLDSRMFAARHQQSIDANRELLALGAGNLASAAISAFPVSSSASRTAIADSSGAKTQAYSLVAAAIIVGVLLGLGDLLAYFPMAALGGLVVYAATRLVDVQEFRRLWRFRRREFLLAITATLAVLVLGILYGILAAIAISITELLTRVARPHAAVLGQAEGVAGWHDVDDYPGARQIPGLLVFRYDSPLFFANAEDFRRDARAAIEASPTPPKWLLLNMEAIVQVDITGLDALDQLVRDCAEREVEVALVRVKLSILRLLNRHGVGERIGSDRVFPTLPTAVQAYIDWRQSED